RTVAECDGERTAEEVLVEVERCGGDGLGWAGGKEQLVLQALDALKCGAPSARRREERIGRFRDLRRDGERGGEALRSPAAVFSKDARGRVVADAHLLAHRECPPARERREGLALVPPAGALDGDDSWSGERVAAERVVDVIAGGGLQRRIC